MNTIKIGSFFAFLSVALGAFGTHSLSKILSAYYLDIFKTGTDYMMWHSLALILVGIISMKKENEISVWPTRFFISGIFLFSGSLFCLTLTGITKFGMITPLGGISFMLGWISLFFQTKINQT